MEEAAPELNLEGKAGSQVSGLSGKERRCGHQDRGNSPSKGLEVREHSESISEGQMFSLEVSTPVCGVSRAASHYIHPQFICLSPNPQDLRI